MGKLLSALARVDLATAGWKTILGLAIVALSMFAAERAYVSKDMAELVALAGLSLAGVGLAGKAKRKLKPHTAKLPPTIPPATMLLFAAMLLPGCVSPGDQFKASSIAYVAAVDTAAELRAHGRLEPAEVAVIGHAVAEGQLALNAWADALAKGEDYPDGYELVSSAVRRIAVYVRGKKE